VSREKQKLQRYFVAEDFGQKQALLGSSDLGQKEHKRHDIDRLCCRYVSSSLWLSLVIDSKTLFLLFLVATLKWNQIVQIPAVPSVPPDYCPILGL
jgi:hypothetical protein